MDGVVYGGKGLGFHWRSCNLMVCSVFFWWLVNGYNVV